ncbi:hypothetical protein Tco_1339727, partial [Tanacetum coccineum]
MMLKTTLLILVAKSEAINECRQHTESPSDLESSKKSGSESQTPLPPLKNLLGASPSSEVMTLTYQDHSPRDRSGLGTMKHTKPKTKESSNKNVLGHINVSDPEQVTSLVPTDVKTNDQELKHESSIQMEDFSRALEEFTSEPIVIKPVVENSKAKASKAKPKAVRKNNVAPIIEDWVSDNEKDDVSQAKIEKKTFKLSFSKIEFVKPKQQEKTARKTINHVEQNSFDHLQVDCKKVNQKQFQNTKPIWNNAKRVNHQNFAKKTYLCPKKNMVPRAVLMKSGLLSLNTAREVNIAHLKITMNSARPMTNLSKSVHSTVKWSIHKNTSFKNSNFNQRVNTVKDKNVNTVRPKAVVNAVKGNNINAVKALACWVWKPNTKVLDHVS